MTLEEAVAIVKPLNDKIAKGPTRGAIEAANQIGDAIVQTTVASRPEFWTGETIRELAIMIDRETGAADMLAALRDLRDDIGKLTWGQPYPGRNHALMDRVEAAIAKATEAA